jgi:hypothetical protein
MLPDFCGVLVILLLLVFFQFMVKLVQSMDISIPDFRSDPPSLLSMLFHLSSKKIVEAIPPPISFIKNNIWSFYL